jgi:hypothetical protein
VVVAIAGKREQRELITNVLFGYLRRRNRALPPGSLSGSGGSGPGWADVDRGLFSISGAAELAGLHPQTLRIYEREGSRPGARAAPCRYSRRDVGRLQEICALTVGAELMS